MLILNLSLCGVALAAFIPQQSSDSNAATPVCTHDIPSEPRGNDTIDAQAVWDPRQHMDQFDYEPTAGQWSGYLDIPGPVGGQPKQLFFWMIESKGNVEKDPIILWLNGGPGCSSLYGLLTQWGPQVFKIKPEGLHPNDADLSERATVIYLDQPVGAGFSYDPNVPKPQRSVSTSEQAADDIVAFIAQFRRTQFNGKVMYQDLHIAGESFAGHYIPPVMARILRKTPSEQLVFNVRSLLIGNGWFDARVQQLSNHDLVCDRQFDSKDAWMLLPADCARIAATRAQCQASIDNCRLPQPVGCQGVAGICELLSDGEYRKLTKRDAYDLNNMRPADNSDRDSRDKQMRTFLRSNDRMAGLGVPLLRQIEWTIIDKEINSVFTSNGDWWRNSRVHLDFILTRTNRPKVLLYAGDTDFVANWIGVKRVAQAIEWAGQANFAGLTDVPVKKWPQLNYGFGVNNDYGSFVSYDNLTYAKIKGAGHMVNEKRPKEAKKMFYQWIFNGKLDSKNGEKYDGTAHDGTAHDL